MICLRGAAPDRGRRGRGDGGRARAHGGRARGADRDPVRGARLRRARRSGSSARIRRRSDPTAPALLAYTSGTTGPPKGAIVTHAAVVHNARVMTEWWPLEEGDVTVAIGAALPHHRPDLSPGHGARQPHAAAAHAPLRPGGVPAPDRAPTRQLLDRPADRLHRDAREPELRRARHLLPDKVASGGAPVFPAVVERWRELTGAYMHNTYGLTETAAPSHMVPAGKMRPRRRRERGALDRRADPRHRIEGGLARGRGRGRGRRWRGRPDRHPRRRGLPGYWERPEESANALHEGWLQTGDVGKRDAEGWFYLVDRIKDLIVASGYKIWPRDVEDVLFRHPDGAGGRGRWRPRRLPGRNGARLRRASPGRRQAKRRAADRALPR